MIMVSIALVMSVIVTSIYLRKENGDRVPVCLRKIFLRASRRRNSLTDKVTTISENHISENNKHDGHRDIELDSLSAPSEIDMLTHKSASRHRTTPSSGHPLADSGEDPHEIQKRYADEWKSMARAVDTLFFWLFLSASVAALTAVFAQIPRYRAT